MDNFIDLLDDLSKVSVKNKKNNTLLQRGRIPRSAMMETNARILESISLKNLIKQIFDTGFLKKEDTGFIGLLIVFIGHIHSFVDIVPYTATNTRFIKKSGFTHVRRPRILWRHIAFRHTHFW